MLSHDDPRLTRFALDEMNDDDRAAFERELTGADRAEIEMIRALAGTLAGALSLEPRRTVAPPLPQRMIGPRTRWILAAAASVAIVGLIGAATWRTQRLALVGSAMEKVGRGTVPHGDENRNGNLAFKDAPNKVYAGAHAEFQQRLAGAGKTSAYARRDADAAKSSPADLLTYPTGWPDLAARRDGSGAATSARVSNMYALGDMAAADSRGQSAPNVMLDVVAEHRLAVDADGDGVVDLGWMPTSQPELAGGDSYAKIRENPFLDSRAAPLSTFGIDVDTASYANVRRFLQNGARPPADAVRVEELINYFPTSDAPPTDGKPFATYAEVARCPWNASHQLVRVALKAKEIAVAQRPTSNLVFLIDVSGSMNPPDRLPLVKRGLQQLVEQLGENDRVAIVVYAGNSGLALPSTSAANKDDIRRAIDTLEAGGSTNGGQGIALAYGIAQANFVKGGVNRVILCTDGDFNVGVTDRNELTSMVTEKAKAGVFLSVLGVGRGNLKDDTMESLADKGNGNYAYIDSDREARKVLVEQASGTLVTVAKDVKIQVEFNPDTVRTYRLIGYENRALAARDFNDDMKDAGEIGAGHNVVALYEIEPVARPEGALRANDAAPPELRYQRTATAPMNSNFIYQDEVLTLKLRFKAPDAPLEQGTSQLIERQLRATDRSIEQASPDFQFAAAVAGFGMMLRGSSSRGDVDWPMIARLAKAGLGADVGGHRAEFVTLVDRAASLTR